MRILGIITIFLLVLMTPAFGTEHQSGNTVTIDRDRIVQGDLFASARLVFIDGNVTGDVYAACKQVVIKGDVGQDAHAACRSLEIYGNIKESLLFFGHDLLIDGHVGGDVLIFGGQVRITPNAVIDGDLHVKTGELKMEGGHIHGALSGDIGAAFLNGTVDKGLILNAGKVEFGDDFHAQADTKLTLGEPLDETRGNIPENLDVTIKKQSNLFSYFRLFWSITSSLVVGLVLVLFFRQSLRDFIDFSRSDPLKYTGFGFIYLIVVPVAVLILLLLILTIPIALTFSALYLIALYVGVILAGLSVGDYIIRRWLKNRTSHARSLFLSVIVGVILVKLVSRIPFVGWFFGLAILCFGLGSLVNFLWNLRRSPEAPVES